MCRDNGKYTFCPLFFAFCHFQNDIGSVYSLGRNKHTDSDLKMECV